MCKLDHVAISVVEFEQYKKFFEQLGMTVERETGEAPTRQLWFCEGIQLKEVSSVENGTHIDHIALGTGDIEKTVSIALANGCKEDPRGSNWFVLSNGTVIELMKTE